MFSLLVKSRKCFASVAGVCLRRIQLSTGIVKFFNDQKGYGFITPDDGGSDLFVHRSNVQTADQTLSDDQRVEYESGQGRKGPEAQQVRPI